MNRTGTKSFHHMFVKAGYGSVHYNKYSLMTSIGEKMCDAHERESNNYLNGMDRFVAYSDMFFHRNNKWCDGVKLFKELEEQYPNAFFVLQTREIEGWLRSKRNHKKGDYLQRARQYHQLSEDEMIDWFRKDRDDHHDRVREHFKHSTRFIEFDIEKDNINTFIDFLKPEINLYSRHWKHIV